MAAKVMNGCEFWLHSGFLSDDLYLENEAESSAFSHHFRRSSSNSFHPPSLPPRTLKPPPPPPLAQIHDEEMMNLALIHQRLEISRKIQKQLQAARFYQMKREQMMKEQWEWHRACEEEKDLLLLQKHHHHHHHHHQQQHQNHRHCSSGMRAVFLNGARRESTGTGVFLPRRVGSTNEPDKKPACSTVLLPARVVQALNLDLDEEGVFIGRGDAVNPLPAVRASHDVRLPSEWPY